jgi:regulator of protease activity HflC (stomatin/prohibitin superfamily)
MRQTVADASTLSELLTPKFASVVQRIAGAFTFDEIERDMDGFITKVVAEINVELNGLVADEGVVEYFSRA